MTGLPVRTGEAGKRVKSWWFLALAAGLLLLLVWGGAQPQVAGLLPAPWDKLGHFAIFAVLAASVLIGVGRKGWVVVVLAFVAIGAWDEWRQVYLPGRSADFGDLLFDTLGVLAGGWVGSFVRETIKP